MNDPLTDLVERVMYAPKTCGRCSGAALVYAGIVCEHCGPCDGYLCGRHLVMAHHDGITCTRCGVDAETFLTFPVQPSI